MEEKEKYGIKDKSHNNSSSKEVGTLNFIRCLTSSPCMKTNGHVTPLLKTNQSKTNTTTGKTMLRLVKIQSFRKIGVISRAL
jgi:hypothetical protein